MAEAAPVPAVPAAPQPGAVPGHVPPDAVQAFDYHHDPRVSADPFGVFDAARGKRAFFSPTYGGYWVLTGAADIREAFQHPEVGAGPVLVVLVHVVGALEEVRDPPDPAL